MKKAAHVLSKLAAEGAAGRFFAIHQAEHEVLAALPLWFYRLFVHLVELADFRTGHGTATYAQLLHLLQPLQPNGGGKRHFVPDIQALKRAVTTLEQRRLIRRDLAHSQAGQALFFAIHPRATSLAYIKVVAPSCDPPLIGRKASIHAGSSDSCSELRPPVVTPSSTMNSVHSKEGKLSTCGQLERVEKARAEVKRLAEELTARSRVQNRAPKGAKELRPDGRTPPEAIHPEPPLPQ
jgi:hypothetical protein